MRPSIARFESFGGLRLRKMHGCLYGRQQILTSVLRFASERSDLLLTSLLLSNVPRDFRCSYDLAFGVSYRRNRQRDCNQTAMLATPNGLVALDPLSPPDTRENLTFFIVAVFRNNNRDRLANCFFGSVAEDALCAFIPAYDNAIEILAYDYVIARLHDRRNPTQSLFTFAQRVLELLALVDERLGLHNVAIDLKYGVVAEQLHPAVHNDFVAILADMS